MQRLLARRAYTSGDLRAAFNYWNAQGEAPEGPMDLTMVAEIFAAAGDARALGYIEQLRALQPAEAEAILAMWYATARQPSRRWSIWPRRFAPIGISRGRTASCSSQPRSGMEPVGPESGPERPVVRCAGRALRRSRARPAAALMYVNLGLQSDFDTRCVAAFTTLEPYVPWTDAFSKSAIAATNHTTTRARRRRVPIWRSSLR